MLGAEHQSDSIRQPASASDSIDSGYAELQSNPIRNLNGTVVVRYDVNSGFGGQFTWRFAPTYFIQATGTKLSGQRRDRLQGYFDPQRAVPGLSGLRIPSGNPDLKPESSLGYDLGFEQAVKGDLLQFGATWYHNAIRNLIDDNASFTSLCQRRPGPHYEGVEAFVALQPVKVLSLRLDYTYTEAQDDVLMQELLRRPRDKWTLDGRWQATERLSLDATLLAVSSWIDGNRAFTISRLTAPGYTTADLAASYDVTSQVTVYGRVANLFDARYENPVGFLRPSRGVFAGVKARF